MDRAAKTEALLNLSSALSERGAGKEMSARERERAAALMLRLERELRPGRMELLYPDEEDPELLNEDGGLMYPARHRYHRHLEFFAQGHNRERAVIAGNRTGKTEMGCYELCLHLTGRYPPWWEGKRFKGPIEAWACGKTNQTTKEVLHAKLFGETGKEDGGGERNELEMTGMLPPRSVDQSKVKFRPGFSGLVMDCHVKYRDSALEYSKLGLRAYEQGRRAFEGAAKHVILLDEEPPMNVYGECLIRTGTVGGIMMLTFTPLEGMSDVVMNFLKGKDEYAELGIGRVDAENPDGWTEH